MRHHWDIEEIEPTDRAGLIRWARDICSNLDIKEAAEALNVPPSPDAVVNALTRSLPEDVRDEVAESCRKSLKTASS